MTPAQFALLLQESNIDPQDLEEFQITAADRCDVLFKHSFYHRQLTARYCLILNHFFNEISEVYHPKESPTNLRVVFNDCSYVEFVKLTGEYRLGTVEKV